MAFDVLKYESRLRDAVTHFWSARARQVEKQARAGTRDQGARGAVTGGAQMDGFADLIAGVISDAGVKDACIFRRKRIELPGFFRPTKEWDALVVVDGKFLAAIEMKSQVGPSFGNNFNNRAEEAIGSAVDLWTAFREGAFKDSQRPWLGYLFLLEDCERSRVQVTVKEPHFEVFKEFRNASYAKRYELFCRKLIRERHYNAAVFLTSDKENGAGGAYQEPAGDLAFRAFIASLFGHLSAYAAIRKKP